MAVTGGVLRADQKPDPAIMNLPDWQHYLGDPVDAAPYGMPSSYERDVIRRSVPWLTADPISSVNFTPIHALDGFVTPNGICFERHHAGAIDVDPTRYRLMIHGMVEKPLVFTIEDLKRLPRVNKFYFLECAANSGMEWRGAQLNGAQFTHGMIHCVHYSGVKLSTLLDQCGVKPKGKWLHVEGGDASGMNRSVPIEKAMDDCLIAFSMNGEALRKEQGYPARLVLPGWEGNMWIKWIRRIEVGDQPWHAREETSKYTDLMANGKARRFTWPMDVKSVITAPSPQNESVKHKGQNIISGLAWSGHGKISRVDVTLDGGKNWHQAELPGPVLDKCLTRFYFNFDWNGDSMLLQSRAYDETGAIQPTKDQLRQVRGVNSIYHNNAIQTWLLSANGVVENVEISG
ncbi:MAG: sulfite dehydrogenase [Alphaproteobacteria bacterium]